MRVVAWLYQHLHHTGTKTMWAIAQRVGSSYFLEEIEDAYHDYSTCAWEALHPHRLAATDGQVVRGENFFDSVASELCRASTTGRTPALL